MKLQVKTTSGWTLTVATGKDRDRTPASSPASSVSAATDARMGGTAWDTRPASSPNPNQHCGQCQRPGFHAHAAAEDTSSAPDFVTRQLASYARWIMVHGTPEAILSAAFPGGWTSYDSLGMALDILDGNPPDVSHTYGSSRLAF